MSSVQFAGSSDGRRRRRLAVQGDVAPDGGAESWLGSTLPESEAARIAAALPWAPRTPWKAWTLLGVLALGLGLLATFVIKKPVLPNGVSLWLDPLLRGNRAEGVVFVQTLLWVAGAQLCWLIGWHRARSRLDFGGRYRIWTWATLVCAAVAFCVSTGWHIVFGRLAARWQWLPYRPEAVGWVLPALGLVLLLAVSLDRELRRSVSALWLWRVSLLQILIISGVTVWEAECRSWPLLLTLRPALELYAAGCLIAAFWMQLRLVAYVTPDPWQPAATALTLFGRLQACWRWCAAWLKRPTPEPEEAPVKRRRKTSAAASTATSDSDEEATTPRRRKKPATAKKTTPRTRTRTRVLSTDEEPTDDELIDDSFEAADPSTRAPSYEGASESDDWQSAAQSEGDGDLTEAELERLTNPMAEVRTERGDRKGTASEPQRPATAPSRAMPEPTRAQERQPIATAARYSAASETADTTSDDYSSESDNQRNAWDSDDYGDGDGDDDSGGGRYRADDGGSSLKGLSKKQRRELKRQQKQGL